MDFAQEWLAVFVVQRRKEMSIKQEVVEKVYDNNAALLLIDELVWALANNADTSKILTALKSHADSVYVELSDDQAEADAKAEAEYLDYVASVHHAAAD